MYDLFVQIVVRRWGAPWSGAPGCTEYDEDALLSFLAVIGLNLPALTCTWALMQSIFHPNIFSNTMGAILFVNEIFVLVFSAALPDIRDSTPKCAYDELARLCHESAIATCTAFLFTAWIYKEGRHRTFRQRVGIIMLVVYYALSIFGPLYLQSFSILQVGVGAAVGALAGYSTTWYLYREILPTLGTKMGRIKHVPWRTTAAGFALLEQMGFEPATTDSGGYFSFPPAPTVHYVVTSDAMKGRMGTWP